MRHFNFFLATLGALCVAVAAGGGNQPSKEQLDQLLAAYKAYGLPLPPEDAILVRYRYQPSWISAAGTKPAAMHGLAFLLKPAKKQKEADVLAGLWHSPKSSYEKLDVVEQNPALLERIDVFHEALAQAIQCHARGWHELSQALLERARKEDDKPTAIQLAHWAWMFWTGDLNSANVDWSKLAPQLKIILDREPKAFDAHHVGLVRSMELALRPSNAKAGSVEALIDDFIVASTRTTLLREANTDFDFARSPLPPDPRYIKINLLGFDAVPALIAHLDDDRLTRIRVHGEMDAFPGYQCRVRHLASDLLEDLAGTDLGRDSRRRLEGHSVDPAKADAWWKASSRLGEEAYLLRYVVGDSPDANWHHQLMLDIIAKKYRQHLPALYRKILDERPKMSSSAVADAIARSDLPKDKQRELFLKAAASKNVDRRCEGLAYLHDLDPKQFDAIMIASIGEIEGSPLGYDARFAQLAQETANPEVWAALQRVAARAFPPARQGYLAAVGNQEQRKPGDKRRLQFLAHFLDDATSGRYRCEFGTLEIRNNAAWNLSKVLELKVEPQSTWTDAQWAALRKEVKAALTRAGIK